MSKVSKITYRIILVTNIAQIYLRRLLNIFTFQKVFYKLASVLLQRHPY